MGKTKNRSNTVCISGIPLEQQEWLKRQAKKDMVSVSTWARLHFKKLMEEEKKEGMEK